MIPEFDKDGRLPSGLHQASLDEIGERFGKQSEVRVAQMQSIRWLVELARRDDVRRIVINGSFVTDVLEPNDVDCVILVGPEFCLRQVSEAEWLAGLPFIHMAFASQAIFDDYVMNIFATDRFSRPKGMIEVRL